MSFLFPHFIKKAFSDCRFLHIQKICHRCTHISKGFSYAQIYTLLQIFSVYQQRHILSGMVCSGCCRVIAVVCAYHQDILIAESITAALAFCSSTSFAVNGAIHAAQPNFWQMLPKRRAEFMTA